MATLVELQHSVPSITQLVGEKENPHRKKRLARLLARVSPTNKTPNSLTWRKRAEAHIKDVRNENDVQESADEHSQSHSCDDRDDGIKQMQPSITMRRA
jgi:hypothetical protein